MLLWLGVTNVAVAGVSYGSLFVVNGSTLYPIDPSWSLGSAVVPIANMIFGSATGTRLDLTRDVFIGDRTYASHNDTAFESARYVTSTDDGVAHMSAQEGLWLDVATSTDASYVGANGYIINVSGHNISTPIIGRSGVVGLQGTSGTASGLGLEGTVTVGQESDTSAGVAGAVSAYDGHAKFLSALWAEPAGISGGTQDDIAGLRVDAPGAGSGNRWTIYAGDGNSVIGGKLNVGAMSAPSSALTVTDGDVFVTTSTRGIILTSPDGSCYHYTAANGGALVTNPIACP